MVVELRKMGLKNIYKVQSTLMEWSVVNNPCLRKPIIELAQFEYPTIHNNEVFDEKAYLI